MNTKKEKPRTEVLHKNYIYAARLLMAEKGFVRQQDAADFLEMHLVSLNKILGDIQPPTLEQALTLCEKGNFNANWLFLNRGPMYSDESAQLSDIYKLLQTINRKLP